MPVAKLDEISKRVNMTEKRLELVRGLGAWASAAIVVGTMIGTGIFLKPAEMAREGRSVSVVFAAWIVGAILSIFGALSFAELGCIDPRSRRRVRLSPPRLRPCRGVFSLAGRTPSSAVPVPSPPSPPA